MCNLGSWKSCWLSICNIYLLKILEAKNNLYREKNIQGEAMYCFHQKGSKSDLNA
jgi:hypothetical protein